MFTTTSPISLLFFAVTTVCGECLPPASLLSFGSITFTNATAQTGARSVPLSATELFPMAMHGITIGVSSYEVSNVIVAQPTNVKGSSFTTVQLNPETLTLTG